MPGSAAQSAPRRRSLAGLSQYRELNCDFWTFFVAALFYEAGFGLYFFLFNLYLLDFHFDEKAIGLINGALSLGLLVSTLPVGFLARKFGNQPLLLFVFVAAPFLGVLRAVCMWEPAQIGLAIAAGLVMSIWTVCFLPASASFTSEKNRAAAIGLIFSVGIGATALGSGVSGYFSRWIGRLWPTIGPADAKRAVLLVSCAFAVLGLLPLMRLPNRAPAPQAGPALRVWDLSLLRNSFLRRYLPCVALWNCLMAAFTPFASVYFVRERHISLPHIGLIFSLSQMAQLVAGLLIPIFVRGLGMLKTILVAQLGTALLLMGLVMGQDEWCVAAFVIYSAAQWMSSTAIYTLLMNVMPEGDRSAASAMIMFSNSLLAACATPAAGALLVRFRYAPVLTGMAALEAALAILFWLFMEPRHGSLTVTQASLLPESAADY